MIDGFTYLPGFVSEQEEQTLLARLKSEPFEPLAMRGQRTRRSIVSYGLEFRPLVGTLAPAPALPRYLHRIRARAAELVGLPAESLKQSLLTKYPASSDIGWHVDHQSFGDVVLAISLLGNATLALRRHDEEYRLAIEARSIYILRGAARSEYQHKVTAKTLRYSITLRPVSAQ